MLRACTLSLALISAITMASAQTPASALTPPAPAVYVRPAPPGELVDIGGRRLHVECKGDTAGPTVIFEAGLSQFTAHSTYGKAQELIAPFARVCIYDRAGLGWSDPVHGVRTQQDMVEDLHRLVAARKLPGPLVLVGHSMGGLLARLYAKLHPADVAAIVLVDASSESYIYGEGLADARKGIVAKIDEGLTNARGNQPVVPMPAGTPADVMMAFTPSILRTLKQEYLAIELVPQELRQAQGYGSLGGKPLAVLRRGKTATPPSDTDTSWREMQEALTQLSTRSFLVVAENAGHVIPYDEPSVVAEVVRRTLTELGKR